MGYNITEFYDRTECNPFKYQAGYLEVIVEPLLTTWTDFLPIICKQEVIDKGLEDLILVSLSNVSTENQTAEK